MKVKKDIIRYNYLEFKEKYHINNNLTGSYINKLSNDDILYRKN